MKKIIFILLLFNAFVHQSTFAQSRADNTTPSKSMYFSWINHAWEGTNEKQTLINYEFFKWLHDTYGMKIDIYLFDAGNIDGSRDGLKSPFDNGQLQYTYESTIMPLSENINIPRQFWLNDALFCGAPVFRHKFPNGFSEINEKFTGIGTRLGVWLGPDGFGQTPAEAEYRRKFLVGLAKDYNMALFKFDAAGSNLREEKIEEFIRTMTEVRQYVPDLISLNHRIRLNAEGLKHMTTFLWSGKETYIDVHISNNRAATHARMCTLERGLPPEMQRLTEDHGVCLSSCLDYWQDDLIVQAFSRNLIIAPEIYGNPWLLRDREFAELARIFNIHRQYNPILVNGLILPETVYGVHAVSRGDDNTRLVTMVNLDWTRENRILTVDETIGIKDKGLYEVRQYHPTEKIIGYVSWGESIPVEVESFRSSLVRIAPAEKQDIGIEGIDYQVLKDITGSPIEVELLGKPGQTYEISLKGDRPVKQVTIDGKKIALQSGGKTKVSFNGKQLKNDYHRKLQANFEQIPIPEDSEKMLETVFFGLDNNALEVRSLMRSGETSIPQVKAARDAFFESPLFVELGIWDRQLFDGNMKTGYTHYGYSTEIYEKDVSQKPGYEWGTFRLDLGRPVVLDSILFKGITGDYHCSSVEASNDLTHWETLSFADLNDGFKITVPQKAYRYYRILNSPEYVAEIEGYSQGKIVERKEWKANNLFPHYKKRPVVSVRKATVRIDEAAPESYLAIPLEGKHGKEGAYVVVKIDGKYVCCPDRVVSYPAHAWEYRVVARDSDYTCLFPIKPEMTGKNIEIYVLGLDAENNDFIPSVWITSAFPYAVRKMVIAGY